MRVAWAAPLLLFTVGCHPGPSLAKATLPQTPPWVVSRLQLSPQHLADEVRALAPQAARQHKRLLLFFGASWCGPCHLVTRAFQRPANRALLSGWYLVHLDVDALPPGAPLGVDFEGIPFFMKLDEQGKVQGTLTGVKALGAHGRPDEVDGALARFLRA